jgi:methoxymalonate biosynthesis protein
VIKCVIWDLDNTLLDGVYLESSDVPPSANARLAGVLHDLAGRGILQAVASKNPPEAAQHAERVTGHAFAATQCGWGAKSAAIRAIMAELGLTADAVAFVDDDALERAEVSYTLPDVLVLEPQDMPDAAAWPQFSPPVMTDEARRRGELYAQRRARQDEARAFGGSRDEFLRYSQTRVTIGPATAADLPRLHELSIRTHQFNSAGTAVSEAQFADFTNARSCHVATVRLADRFGDDGLVGSCVMITGETWQVPLLMMSCRALGRGVIDAFLTWICRAAQAAGATQVALPCLITPQNVPLRIALTRAGFRVGPAEDPRPGNGALRDSQTGRTAVYVKELDGRLPDLPSWVCQP